MYSIFIKALIIVKFSTVWKIGVDKLAMSKPCRQHQSDFQYVSSFHPS